MEMNSGTSNGNLYRLARLYNVQTAHYDVNHRRRQASVESLLAVLKALGAPVASLNDVPSALRERMKSLRARLLEPVTVARDGERPVIKICLTSDLADAPCNARLDLESGESFSWKWQAGELPVLESADVDGRRYVTRRITLPHCLPTGYHKFAAEVKGNSGETMIISAPRKTYSPPVAAGRMWGAFLPLYALRTRNDWGSGDYSGLGVLAESISGVGGQVVATLPLLPVFLDEPFEPSPYAPVSRRLWNEFYIDVNDVPELAACAPARELMQSSSFRAEIENLRESPLVDYRRLMALKRRVLEELGRCLLGGATERLEEFKRFARANPIVEEYARFRAVMEKRRESWFSWPQPLRDGILKEGDYDEDIKNYHLYAQWLAQRQVQALSKKSHENDVMLYFDLPLGVHPDGYDVWRERRLFALGASTGAPPDAVFTTGQNWGFPPLHPESNREQRYRYVIDYLRHHLAYANMLRIDHVMGLHRLFWIPSGLDAARGVYVRYPADELYAILAVESHRHRSIIVGEDLGIVPSYVRPAMARHGLHRMYVLRYELAENAPETIGHIPRASVASLNTHDMPPFASFWEDIDIGERKSLGQLDEKEAVIERLSRSSVKNALVTFLRNRDFLNQGENSTWKILKACLACLSNSRARIILVNLEDLWLEKRSQNVPGTGNEHPNWRRKARYGLEKFCQMPEVTDTLREISDLRRQGKGPFQKEK